MLTFSGACQEKLTFPGQTHHYTFGEMSLRELISLRISMLAANVRSDCECNTTPNSVSQNAHVSYLFLTMQDCERNRIAYCCLRRQRSCPRTSSRTAPDGVRAWHSSHRAIWESPARLNVRRLRNFEEFVSVRHPSGVLWRRRARNRESRYVWRSSRPYCACSGVPPSLQVAPYHSHRQL